MSRLTWIVALACVNRCNPEYAAATGRQLVSGGLLESFAK
jgi:hypothetical protein